MPLSSGKSKAAFSHNVAAEVEAGKPQKQAVAIAYAKKRGDSKPSAEEIKAAIKAGEEELKHQRAALAALDDAALDGVLEEADRLYEESRAASKALNAIPKTTGKMGLTSAETKANPEWQAAKQRYERAAAALQNFNSQNMAAIKAARKAGRDCDVDMDEDVENDCSMDSARRIVFDRRMETIDGHLVVTGCHISKANVCPYLGSEIPNATELGLDPSKTYMLYRDSAELQASVKTYERVPLMLQHVAVSAESPQQFLVIGTVSNVKFAHPYLDADLTVWTREGIDAIESGKQRELSCGYRYTADMTPGTSPEGVKYDGRMTNITCNHVAIVEAGRCGPDVMVVDAKPG